MDELVNMGNEDTVRSLTYTKRKTVSFGDREVEAYRGRTRAGPGKFFRIVSFAIFALIGAGAYYLYERREDIRSALNLNVAAAEYQVLQTKIEDAKNSLSEISFDVSRRESEKSGLMADLKRAEIEFGMQKESLLDIKERINFTSSEMESKIDKLLRERIRFDIATNDLAIKIYAAQREYVKKTDNLKREYARRTNDLQRATCGVNSAFSRLVAINNKIKEVNAEYDSKTNHLGIVRRDYKRMVFGASYR